MKALKFLTIFFILAINGAKFNHKFLQILCNTSKITVINEKCYIKSYDRRTPMANVEFFIIRHVPDLKVSIKLYHKTSSTGEYRNVLTLERIELCKILKGLNFTPFLNSLFDYLKSFIDLNLLCTITGQVNYNNWTYPDSAVSI
ncbi:hypothetical protein PVAND_016487 [Polypedilum vanderplanki]|uniref:Uncharacterized protein n=1 Tax=Polypedilum vanderplanki TaxID=319348 RepID=A0A9J6BFK1_POLVA|nr:hypothetical protein PVAND_016487 [Polypedilum vanderplanki]